MTDPQQQALPTLPAFSEEFLTFIGEDGIWNAIDDWRSADTARDSILASKVIDERIKSAMRAYAAEAVARALAASAPSREVPGWLPIETAPKDGTTILLWEEWSSVPFVGRWYDRRSRLGADTEHYDTDGDACVIDKICRDLVTHWMPLPDAPSPSVAAEETKP